MDQTLLHRAWRAAATEVIVNRTACAVLGVVSFAAATALGAWVRVPLPFTPVPITLQTFFVLLAGAMMGWRLGAASQILYIAAGAAGLRIFTTGGGLEALAGPTGGYLIGFAVAAAAVGLMKDMSPARPAVSMTLAMIVGTAAIYALGASWLAFVTHSALRDAVAMGVLPFLPGDALKAAAAAALAMTTRRRCRAISAGPAR